MTRGARRAAAVGVAQHGNAAVLVTVGPGGELLDRRRIELTDPALPTHPHHREGAWAMGRYLGTPGARAWSLADAVALVERVRASAARGARDGLDALAAAVPVPIARIAIRACPALPPTIEERIADNRAQTQADSVMYREALASAAEARGWSVHWYDSACVLREAAAALGIADVEATLRAMGRSIGPPWQATHKLAAAAALAASGRARSGSGLPASRVRERGAAGSTLPGRVEKERSMPGTTFPRAIVDAFDRAKILGVRAGASHRYTGVWVVVVDGRPFVRSWNDKPTGWFRAFRREPAGSVQIEGVEIAVRGVVVRSARIREAVSAAYAAKYDTPGSRTWVAGFRSPARMAATLELQPAATRRSSGRAASARPKSSSSRSRAR